MEDHCPPWWPGGILCGSASILDGLAARIKYLTEKPFMTVMSLHKSPLSQLALRRPPAICSPLEPPSASRPSHSIASSTKAERFHTEFKATLGYTVRHRLKTKQETNKKIIK